MPTKTYKKSSQSSIYTRVEAKVADYDKTNKKTLNMLQRKHPQSLDCQIIYIRLWRKQTFNFLRVLQDSKVVESKKNW